MHLTDAFGNVAGDFTDGNPSTGTPPTRIEKEWLNAVQHEIANAVLASGQALTKGLWTQLRDAIPILAGASAPTGFANLLINGDMRLFQRGTSLALGADAVGFVADRWRHHSGVGGAATISRQAFTVGGAPAPGLGKYYLRHQQTTGASSQPRIAQRVEMLEEMAAGKWTRSFWARCGSGTVAATPRVTQNFGAGGSADVNVDAAGVTLTTTWQLFTVTVDLPSISGKTVGVAPFVAIELMLPQSATYTVDLVGCNLNRGAVALPFVADPPQIALARASRYYWKTYDVDVVPGTVTNVGALLAEDSGAPLHNMQRVLPVPMRATGTKTWRSPRTAGAGGVGKIERPFGSDATVSATSDDGETSTGFPTTSSGGGNPGRAHLEIDAEL